MYESVCRKCKHYRFVEESPKQVYRCMNNNRAFALLFFTQSFKKDSNEKEAKDLLDFISFVNTRCLRYNTIMSILKLKQIK